MCGRPIGWHEHTIAMQMSVSSWRSEQTPAYQLFVRHTCTLTVEARASDDVGVLLEDAAHKACVPHSVLWLTFKGRPLAAGRSLASYGLSAGATVHLAVRGRGGAPKPSNGAFLFLSP
jgi:hypothetical protein